MKKRFVLLVLFLAIVFLGWFFKNPLLTQLFGNPAPVQKTALNITIDAFPPDIIIYSPVSKEYSTDNVGIKYSVSDSASGVDTVWYNLDGSQNITLTGDDVITVSKGNHILHIYVMDKAGLVNGTEFVAFSVL